MDITFTGERLDRAADRRTEAAWVAAQAASPHARAVLAGDAGIHVTDGDAPRLALLPLAALDAPEPLLLGLDDHGPVFAVDESPSTGAVAAHGEGAADRSTGTRPLGLRAAAATLSQADAGLAAHAAALVNWHRRHPHCSVCGALTEVVEGGTVRHCPVCGSDHHPRTDPVVIMLVTDGDRVLLGRQAGWPAGRYSALAGFVEPGESLEEAVAREVREEAGVEIGPPVYFGSQPWPFPTSLMLGFTAPWASGEPRRADSELEDVRWFTRAEIDEIVFPPRFAIAARLIEGWLQR